MLWFTRSLTISRFCSVDVSSSVPDLLRLPFLLGTTLGTLDTIFERFLLAREARLVQFSAPSSSLEAVLRAAFSVCLLGYVRSVVAFVLAFVLVTARCSAACSRPQYHTPYPNLIPSSSWRSSIDCVGLRRCLHVARTLSVLVYLYMRIYIMYIRVYTPLIITSVKTDMLPQRQCSTQSTIELSCGHCGNEYGLYVSAPSVY